MDEKKNTIFNVEGVEKALWKNWAISFGAITLPLLLGLWVPMFWISLITLVEAWILVVAIKADFNNILSTCSLFLRIATRTLITSALIMIAISILCTDWLVPTVIYLDLYNPEIPFITCLIVYPCAIFYCAMWLYSGHGDAHCRDCQKRNGYYAGDSIAATIYYKETRYQVILLMSLSLLLGGIQYWYYFYRYINSDFSSPDHFFFNFMPTAVFAISLLFMYGRYASMTVLYQTLDPKGAKRNKTTVRFLVFCGDELLTQEVSESKFDTPAEKIINRTKSISESMASGFFKELLPVKDFKLRYCFTNDGFSMGSNIIHYAVFLPESQHDAVPEEDIWMNAVMLDNALATNTLAPVLSNELFRIHTMTMAWKTYDRNGRRLYPIRHYRPTFRFRDFPTWTLDYDDETWFDIASNNEDRRFFRVRDFWNRITNIFNRRREATDGR